MDNFTTETLQFIQKERENAKFNQHSTIINEYDKFYNKNDNSYRNCFFIDKLQ